MTGPAPAGTALRCSFAAELRGDPLPGTAAPARGLVLVEQPGPWGRAALTQSRLDPAVGAALATRAADLGLRTLLIRRTGREADHGRARRRWARVDCTPGAATTRWGWFERDAELLDVALDAASGETADGSTYLVCTHGRHDACCAIRGRPVAAALAALRPDAVWECSHVGGDRFAANVLALPHGLYYGRVDADRAAELVAAHERGEVVLDLLRGRAVHASPVQAAQEHARRALGAVGIDDLPPVGADELADGSWRVLLAHPGGDVEVTVRSRAFAAPALLTCGAAEPAAPPLLEVTGFRRAS